MKKCILLLISFLTLSGCLSLPSLSNYDKKILFLGNEEMLIKVLDSKNLDFHHNEYIDNIEVVITNKDYIENNNNLQVIKEILDKNKEVYIYGYRDTQFIQKAFFESNSFDSSKDNRNILVKLKKNGESIDMIHFNYKDRDKSKREFEEIVRKM